MNDSFSLYYSFPPFLLDYFIILLNPPNNKEKEELLPSL